MTLVNAGELARGRRRVRDLPPPLPGRPQRPAGSGASGPARRRSRAEPHMVDADAIRQRLAAVRDRIGRAALRAGRDPAGVRLVAVSKTFPAEYVRAAADAGQVDFGENKVQEALQKKRATTDLVIRWHLIGHLQSNKARKAGAEFDAVHSVDSPSLVAALDEAAQAAGRQIELLVQVDLSGEATKHGAREDMLGAVFDRRARVSRRPPDGADAAAAGGRRSRGGASVLQGARGASGSAARERRCRRRCSPSCRWA